MEPNWRDGKGIDFVHGFDKVIYPPVLFSLLATVL